MIEVSVIIVNRNTRELLRACLTSINADVSVTSRETIVVDNGSTDGSREMLAEDFPHVRVRFNDHNEGFARPNNDAMRMAQGKYFFLLNSDAWIEPGTLGAMKTFLDTHPEAGACGPRLIYPDGRQQRSVSRSHSLLTHFFDMTGLDRLFAESPLFGGGEMTTCPYDPAATSTVENLMGAAFMTRRTVTEKTGMFDEELSIYYNEMDWFMRMRNDGWGVYYVPTTAVRHHRGATTAIVNSGFQHFTEMYYNVFFFFQKHYGFPAVVVYRLLLIAGFTPRLVLWWGRSLSDRSEYVKHMRTYSGKVLALGLRFWVPVESHRPPAGSP
jgi:hypothetical protein